MTCIVGFLSCNIVVYCKKYIIYFNKIYYVLGGIVMKKHNKNVPAKLMEAVARRSAEIATDSRCVYLFHQPKQPNGIKTLKK